MADQLGGREELTCTIPEGKAILIPLLTGQCGYDIPEVKNDEDLLRCAMAGNEYGVVEASVDGVKLKELKSTELSLAFLIQLKLKTTSMRYLLVHLEHLLMVILYS